MADCTGCGAALRPGAKFCARCGRPVSAAVSTPKPGPSRRHEPRRDAPAAAPRSKPPPPGAAPPAAGERIGFGPRFLAALVDAVIVVALISIVLFVLRLPWLPPFLGAGYFFLEVLLGYTPGKRVLRLVVTGVDGRPASFDALRKRWTLKVAVVCAAQFAAMVVLQLGLPQVATVIGFAPAVLLALGSLSIFGAARQAAHDRLAGTAVHRAAFAADPTQDAELRRRAAGLQGFVRTALAQLGRYLKTRSGLFDARGGFSIQGLLLFPVRLVRARAGTFVRGLLIGAVVHFFAVSLSGGYDDVNVFPTNFLVPTLNPIHPSPLAPVTFPVATAVWTVVSALISYGMALARRRRSGGGRPTIAAVLGIAGVALAASALQVFADDGGFAEWASSPGQFGEQGGTQLVGQSVGVGIGTGIGAAAGADAAEGEPEGEGESTEVPESEDDGEDLPGVDDLPEDEEEEEEEPEDEEEEEPEDEPEDAGDLPPIGPGDGSASGDSSLSSASSIESSASSDASSSLSSDSSASSESSESSSSSEGDALEIVDLQVIPTHDGPGYEGPFGRTEGYHFQVLITIRNETGDPAWLTGHIHTGGTGSDFEQIDVSAGSHSSVSSGHAYNVLPGQTVRFTYTIRNARVQGNTRTWAWVVGGAVPAPPASSAAPGEPSSSGVPSPSSSSAAPDSSSSDLGVSSASSSLAPESSSSGAESSSSDSSSSAWSSSSSSLASPSSSSADSSSSSAAPSSSSLSSSSAAPSSSSPSASSDPSADALASESSASSDAAVPPAVESSATVESSSSSAPRDSEDCTERIQEADRILNRAIAEFQRAIAHRNQRVLKLTDLYVLRYDIALEWAKVKRAARDRFDYHPLLLAGREAVKLANVLLELAMNRKLALVKSALIAWITGVMLGTGKLAWILVAVTIRVWRGVTFVAPIGAAVGDWTGTRITELQIEAQRFMARLETYKWRGDQFYAQHEALVKQYAPRIDQAKQDFDVWWASESDYFKMALQGTWDSVQQVPALVRLVLRFYAALDRLESLGNRWVGLSTELLDRIAHLGDLVVKHMAGDLEEMNQSVQAIWAKREQIYLDCEARGMLTPGTWRRPAPEVTRDENGNIIGVLY
jgi:hypothetical protein